MSKFQADGRNRSAILLAADMPLPVTVCALTGAALAAVLLSGCALTPRDASALSNYAVCRTILQPNYWSATTEAALLEARHRGVDCESYRAAIAKDAQTLKDSPTLSLLPPALMATPAAATPALDQAN